MLEDSSVLEGRAQEAWFVFKTIVVRSRWFLAMTQKAGEHLENRLTETAKAGKMHSLTH